MTRGRSAVPLLAKEFRALLPLWAGTMLALAAAFVWRDRSLSDIGVIGYIGGAVALGAHAIGHEYGHRTLPMLLAQPVPRRRLLIAKLVAAGALLATVAAAAALVLSHDAFRGNDRPGAVALPILGAIFVAPWFTMLCRNTLAGAVLGASAPMTVWVLTMVVAWWGFGVDGDTVTAWWLARWPAIAAAASPVLAMATWRTFARLEAADGTPATLTLPRWMSARRRPRRPAPWRALLAKEFHLQQMTIAITLFYGVIWLAGMAVREAAPPSAVLPMEAVLLLYCLGLALVIGAIASAEERQQGTLDVQLVQPVGALAQWALKCAVALGLSLLLGVALPVLLITAFSGASPVELSPNLVLLVIVLTSSSLYISSLAGSAVAAMAWSLPVGIGAALFIQTARTAVATASMRLGAPLPADQTEALIVAMQLLPVLVVPVLLWFGYLNHVSAEHPLRRTLAQVGVLAVAVMAVIVAAGALI